MGDLRGLQQNFLANSSCVDAWESFASKFIVPEFLRLFEENADKPQLREVFMDVFGDKFVTKNLSHIKRERKLLFLPYMAAELKVELVREVNIQLIDAVNRCLGDVPPAAMDKLAESLEMLSKKHVMEFKQAIDRGPADVFGGILVQALEGSGFDLPFSIKEQDIGVHSTLGIDQPKSTEDIAASLRKSKFDGLVQEYSAWQAASAPAKEHLLESCRGRSLPKSLRLFIFTEALFDQSKLSEAVKELSRNLHLRATQSHIDNSLSASHSKVHNMIARLVDENIRTEFCEWTTQDDRTQFATDVKRLLNKYFVMTGYYHATLLPLLLPLYSEFKEIPGFDDVTFLVMLESLQATMPTRGEASTVAKDIWSRIHQELPETAIAIRKIVEKHLSHQSKVLQNPETELQPFSLFVPWVEGGLMGCLRRDSVLFVWTECLITRAKHHPISASWDVERFIQICLTVVKILESSLVSLQTFSELKRVLSESCKRIFTKELREGLQLRVS